VPGTQPEAEQQKARVEMCLVNKIDGKQIGERPIASARGTRSAPILDVCRLADRRAGTHWSCEIRFELRSPNYRSSE